jgi:hypothetical protein
MTDPTTLQFAMMGIGGGLSAYSSYRGGKAAEDYYKEEAAEKIRQAEFANKLALEEQKDVLEEGQARKGHIRATAGGKGLRVAGSVKGQVNAVSNIVARRISRINMIASERGRVLAAQARSLRKTGKIYRKASKYEVAEGLLGAGLATGSLLYQSGKLDSWLGSKERGSPGISALASMQTKRWS